jgi:hypothetical protein
MLDKNKNLTLYIYGFIIILVGIFFWFSENYPFVIVKSSVGISLLTGAFFALFTAIRRLRKQVEFAYHEMHAFAMFLYGIYVLFFCQDFKSLIGSSVFLFIFYTFSEIGFCIWIFNLGQKVMYRIVILRIALGLFAGIGSVRVLYLEAKDSTVALQSLEVIFIILGINILLYVPVMKGREKPMITEKYISGN